MKIIIRVLVEFYDKGCKIMNIFKLNLIELFISN